IELGIKYHEGGELERSAWYFEQSAKKDGGCGAGMLMYGLTLRHGWGCQVNMELGFRYLQSAAETVVHDLDRVVAGGRELSKEESDTKAVKNELVLALHEIGTSFRFGWGVAKDKKMAVSYFQLAADLGDPDAQSELAFCLANGKGCKKDMKKAAKYYRMAVAQGGETFGLSWIYKVSTLSVATSSIHQH
ncbi:HCP-like protein, partial [Meredithblackwellia eburnea MCA 4105]